MDKEQKTITLDLEWERINDFLSEIDIKALPKGYLSCSHNSYYALFHAICALNIEYNHTVPSTHKGLLNRLYLDFVKPGILSEDDNRICIKAETIRQKADYDGRYKPTKEELEDNYKNIKKLIHKIQGLCYAHGFQERIQEIFSLKEQIKFEKTLPLYTNSKLTGALVTTIFNNSKKTFVLDKQTKDICYCEGHFYKGQFHIPTWKTIKGKPASYTETRVLSLKNKQKLGIK